MEHTPGPWTVNFTPAKDGPTAETFGPNAEANARLIAAAPELLEALEKCQQLATERIKTADAAVKADVYAADALMGIAVTARAALKAAKGDA